MNKEEIEKQLKLSKRQNKDERYDYLCSEFNAINYCANLEKYTNKLQKENQELKEKINGVDEERTYLYNKLSSEKEQLNILVNSCQEEIRRLKKQLEEYRKTNEHLLDKKQFLKQENQSLKKQLEYLRSGEYLNQLRFERDMLQDLVDKKEISKEDKEFIDMTHRNTELLEQQKEFIEYLEDLIKQNETVVEVSKYGLPKNCSKLLIDFYKEILSKYKEIIGVSDESKRN